MTTALGQAVFYGLLLICAGSVAGLVWVRLRRTRPARLGPIVGYTQEDKEALMALRWDMMQFSRQDNATDEFRYWFPAFQAKALDTVRNRAGEKAAKQFGAAVKQATRAVTPGESLAIIDKAFADVIGSMK